jgi:hypothetical protein
MGSYYYNTDRQEQLNLLLYYVYDSINSYPPIIKIKNKQTSIYESHLPSFLTPEESYLGVTQ